MIPKELKKSQVLSWWSRSPPNFFAGREFFSPCRPLYVAAKKQVHVCLSSRWQLSNGLEFEHGTLCTLRPLAAGGKRYTVGGLPYRYKWSDMGPL